MVEQSCRAEGCVASSDFNAYRDTPHGRFVASLFDPMALFLPGRVHPLTNVPLNGAQTFDAKLSILTAGLGMLVKGESAAASAVNEAGSIRGVNTVGGNMNCVNCAIATDAVLAGRPASALGGGPFQIDALERTFGGGLKRLAQ
jgi:hypothetical protein